MFDARCLIFLLGALAAPSAAHAQAESDPSIVVTGQLPLGEEETLDIVRRVARPVDGQLARFQQPVCPQVIGFEAQYEAVVERRIKATAERVGARAGGNGCVANLYVVIVDDGRQFVQALSRQRPIALGGLTRHELDRLASEEGAARAWSSTVLTNSDGAVGGTPAQGGRDALAALNNGYGPNLGMTSDAKVMRVYEGSTINPSTRQAIASAWVVIETGATFGKTLTQIADYAAMRGLAMVRPAELAASGDTILALFEPGADASVPELTDFDLAYLKGLYRIQGRRWARQQVRQLADAIARENERAAP